MSKSEETKKAIIEATRILISQKSSITIREIADACYLNVAAVNYYFGSKDYLLSLVLDQIINEITHVIIDRLNQIPVNNPVEETLEIMINMIYGYAIDNVGLIGYLFMNVENRDRASKLFIDAFFKKGEFKDMVFEKLRQSTGLQDEQALNARYVLLFSCFCIPLVIQILSDSKSNTQIPGLQNETFRKNYINELLRMVK
ncbi:MAG: TetR/AcrR family transcriptional regulator [Candidatus Izemoplasmatales bacterium]|jgi:AcrR family transcriptional regulator|nr:TetR/AcrR family transcriptional regulator [Candidatus Izemoplasmatales bacterium]MDD3864968.1 TetR/AcrR family transcriptional regulator [Candidatus Izemoplasmatales bacterium]